MILIFVDIVKKNSLLFQQYVNAQNLLNFSQVKYLILVELQKIIDPSQRFLNLDHNDLYQLYNRCLEMFDQPIS